MEIYGNIEHKAAKHVFKTTKHVLKSFEHHLTDFDILSNMMFSAL